MHFATLVAFVLPAVLAAPSSGNGLVTRQNDVTDQLIFSVSLSTFLSRRAARDPPSLDWSSDSCSSSPDNPFGFPFDPACQRHDFGYRNFRAQNRFTDANKLRIDDKFLSDLNNQCAGQSNQGACESLARVYYQAVRWFGRSVPASEGDVSVQSSLPQEYLDAVAEYEAEVAKLEQAGKI